MLDHDSDNHYGIICFVGYSDLMCRQIFDVQWFDGLQTTCYDYEIKPFSIRKKKNG